VLSELKIKNLLLIEEAELELDPGLNILTGETGAGKTLLATALGLLLGERSKSGLVRPGAPEALVEGVFTLPSELSDELQALLPDDAHELILARRIWPDGRSRAVINGATATVGDLRALGSAVLSFHGQHEHRQLALATFQMDTLDAAVGGSQPELRSKAAAAHLEVRAAESHLAALSASDGTHQRELDLLRYEVDEIDRIAPLDGEADELKVERERLRRLDGLREALSGLQEATGGDDEVTATELLSRAQKAFDSVLGVDSEVDSIGERLSSLLIELQDAGRESGRLLDGLEASPQRLGEIEQRLDEVDRLLLKHGGTLAGVEAHATTARERLLELDDLEGARDRARATLAEVTVAQGKITAALRKGRLATAKRLGPAVEGILGDLALEGARFEIAVTPRETAGPTGADDVEFLVSANPGLPTAPIGQVASGGEMSRILLALLSVSIENGGMAEGNLIVFDEIDAGIGGRTARAVGSRLGSLAQRRQVLCITHLPQVAAAGDRQFMIAKTAGEEGSTTTVKHLVGAELEAEMVRMLGADEGDKAALAHARELLEEA